MREMVGGCCVCSDERGWTENPLVYCDGHGCNVAVHQACYGIVRVPTGPWFCRKCESQERTTRVRCELCPQKDGALKHTDTGGWCHVVCALFIPEAWFANVQTMEPIVLKNVPQERFNKPCYICDEQKREAKAASGACMQCNKNGCKQNFHVTCAQSHGLLCEEAGNYGDNVKYCGYCTQHCKKLRKDANIKLIPAFQPIPSENATPETTPEKAGKYDKEKLKNKECRKLMSEPPALFRNMQSSQTSISNSVPFSEGQNATSTMSSETASLANNSRGSILLYGEKSKQRASQESLTSQSPSPLSVDSTVSSSTNNQFPGFTEADVKGKTPTSGNVLPDKGKSSTAPNVLFKQGAPELMFKKSPPGLVPSNANSANSNNNVTDSKLIMDARFNIASEPRPFSSPPSAIAPITTQSVMTSPSPVQPMFSGFDNFTSNQEQKAKRPRPQSAEKEKKRVKKPKPVITSAIAATNKARTVKALLTGGQDDAPSKKNKKKKVDNASMASLGTQNYSVFGGSPYFQSLSAPGPVSLNSFSHSNIDGSSAENCSNVSQLIGPPKVFPSLGTVSPKSGESNSSFPTSMEQLLERQWEQGSQFLMEQGQHFDIASLLNCLHQLKSENNRLEDHIKTLMSRRDHLLAVNARLSLPLTPLNNPHLGSRVISPDTVSTQRSARANNVYSSNENSQQQDTPAAVVTNNISRSPSRKSPGKSPKQRKSPAAKTAMSTSSGLPGLAADGQTLHAAAMLGMNDAVRSHLLLQSHLTDQNAQFAFAHSSISQGPPTTTISKPSPSRPSSAMSSAVNNSDTHIATDKIYKDHT